MEKLLREALIIKYEGEIAEAKANISVYLKNGLIKIEIAIAKGKKLWDKRESKKEKDIAKRLKNF